jgi:hypothetical protein
MTCLLQISPMAMEEASLKVGRKGAQYRATC